jgi:uncharacterized protein YjiS (DUF1127 family)
MPPLKQLPYVRSKSRIQAPCRLGRYAAHERAPNYDKTPLSLPRQERPQRSFRAAVSRLLAATAARFPIHAGSTFPNLPLAIFSWMTAEFLAGCAAYAEAMYPTLAIVQGRVAHRTPVPTLVSQRSNPPRGARPGLNAISSKTTSNIEGGPLSLLEQMRFRPEVASRSEFGAQTQQPPNSAWRWYVSVGTALKVLLSKIRQRQARRRAMTELRNFDDRLLRDIGISRCDIESIVRREIWWE